MTTPISLYYYYTNIPINDTIKQKILKKMKNKVVYKPYFDLKCEAPSINFNEHEENNLNSYMSTRI